MAGIFLYIKVYEIDESQHCDRSFAVWQSTAQVMHKQGNMATIRQSMELLKEILGRGCTPEDQRRYHIEWTAYSQVKNGDPYDETPYCHANERYIYRETWERATWQKKIEG